jgi:hypothetical protein
MHIIWHHDDAIFTDHPRASIKWMRHLLFVSDLATHPRLGVGLDFAPSGSRHGKTSIGSVGLRFSSLTEALSAELINAIKEVMRGITVGICNFGRDWFGPTCFGAFPRAA